MGHLDTAQAHWSRVAERWEVADPRQGTWDHPSDPKIAISEDPMVLMAAVKFHYRNLGLVRTMR